MTAVLAAVAAVVVLIFVGEAYNPTLTAKMPRPVETQHCNGGNLPVRLNLCIWPSLVVDPLPDLSS